MRYAAASVSIASTIPIAHILVAILRVIHRQLPQQSQGPAERTPLSEGNGLGGWLGAFRSGILHSMSNSHI